MEPGVLLQDPEGHWPALSGLQTSSSPVSDHVFTFSFLPLHYYIISQWD